MSKLPGSEREIMAQLARLFNTMAHDDALQELAKMYPEDYQQLVEKYRQEYITNAAVSTVKKKGIK